ncbi:hypothetical protein [Deinococcus sonorensis]|uniref:Lipoprotein n=2 Tax=Deinococcus sonorensis TaxID=309891 RepID=A0AAU7U4N3_9DEIO
MNPQRSLILTALTTALLVACSSPSTRPPATTGPSAGKPVHPGVTAGTPALPASNLMRLPHVNAPRLQSGRLKPLAVTANPNLVALRMLIITAGTTDPDLDAAKAMLAQAGVPYDVLDASNTTLTADTLIAPDGSGRYQGVVLTNNSLLYQDSGGNFQYAFDGVEWTTLWQYEATFKVRQLSLYTYPGTFPEDYALRYIDGSASDKADVVAAPGQTITSDLRAGAVIPVRNAYNYPASVLPSSQWAAAGVTAVQPVLTAKNNPGMVLAATSTTTDGRERMALTMSHNQNFLHTQLLGFDLVNWVTKGLYLGQYRRYNQLDIDDWFLADDEYDPVTHTIRPEAFRMSASDALAARDRQTEIQNTYDVARAFRFAVAYNGGGANTAAPLSCDPNVKSVDPLTSVSRCLGSTFDWISHTRDHEYMDFLNYDDSYAQLQPNKRIGTTLGLVFSKKGLVTGDMSGLGYYNANGDGLKTNYGLTSSNANFLQAAQDTNVQYLASNHSVDGQWDPSCPTCGVTHPLNNSVLLIPRWPTNIFYYATTPEEIVSSYNAVYAPGGTLPYWDHALTYAEILDKESDMALNHILLGAAFPHYMHVTNLRQYAPGKSIASDWERAVLTKYSQYSNLPLGTLAWDTLGQEIRRRTTFMKSNVRAVADYAAKTVTITSPSGGAVYVTGLTGTNATVYGGRSTRFWDFSPNQSLTVMLK